MLDRRQTYSLIVTCGSVVLAAIMVGAAAGWAYYQQSRLQRELAIPKQMPTSRERTELAEAKLPLFDPHSYLAEIQSGSNPADVADRYRQSSPYRVRWVIDGWLSTGHAWGHFAGTDIELAMSVPKGMKIGDKMDSAARFLSYKLSGSGGMMFQFTPLD
jgi:hypothetical protein